MLKLMRDAFLKSIHGALAKFQHQKEVCLQSERGKYCPF
ncbi:hypothetical protein CAAU_2667 [Caloramator australicus RC3]|uniref:Uncharacterized protein n=1 Tax=Caloramator australicus RC3 TaxID=857293 RepID=I7LKV7_9CLOT|nr:hypothetical protein CAAU_2667 [Caloramator australicus RC3]